jgi:hypothetical protein
MAANEAFTKKLISKYLHIHDPEFLHQSYLYVSENFAREPLVPAGAMQWMARMNWSMPRLCKDLTAIFDNSFVEELKETGFFERLWK